MKIVTGYTGTEHITSNDDQGRNQGIFGINSYLLTVGNQFAATLSDATHVSIQDGEGVLQGVHFRVDPGTADTVAIDSGTTGQNRIDLIVARYTKISGTSVESVDWAVIKGTPTSGSPSAPAYTEGDILNGDLTADFPIWKVTITGTSPALTKMVDYPLQSLAEVYTSIANTRGLLADCQAQTWTSKHRSGSVTIYPDSNTNIPITIQANRTNEVSMSVSFMANTGKPRLAFLFLDTSGNSVLLSYSEQTMANVVCVEAHFIMTAGQQVIVTVQGDTAGTVNYVMRYWQRPTSVVEG